MPFDGVGFIVDESVQKLDTVIDLRLGEFRFLTRLPPPAPALSCSIHFIAVYDGRAPPLA